MNVQREGVLLVDKSSGCTSFDVVAKVRRTLGVKRVGHAGTLDPMATGLLVLMVGRYTKLSSSLTSERKAYEAVIFFGSSTTTDDREGEVLAQGDASGLNSETLEIGLKSFLGWQDQVPPNYSAVSIKGERAYKRARRGDEFSLPPKKVCFYDLKLLEFNSPFATVLVDCSKGTYVRSLARDLGQKFGIPAHLYGLRRTQCGNLLIKDAIAQECLDDESQTLKALLRSGDFGEANIKPVSVN